MNKHWHWIPDFRKITRAKGAWKKPFKWQKQAAKKGDVALVFGNSLSEFWHPQADQWRDEVWEIVRSTPNLLRRFQTKRPELIAARLPKDWGSGYPNVWLGVTVEMKKYLPRLDILCRIPAVAHLLTAEPLLEDLTPPIRRAFEGSRPCMDPEGKTAPIAVRLICSGHGTSETHVASMRSRLRLVGLGARITETRLLMV